MSYAIMGKFNLKMESSDDATARSRHLEFLDGEWESVVLRIVDHETMEEILLDAFWLVARRDQRAGSSDDHVAFFNASRLSVFDPVGFDVVDDGAPFAIDVDGT